MHATKGSKIVAVVPRFMCLSELPRVELFGVMVGKQSWKLEDLACACIRVRVLRLRTTVQ